MPHTVDCGIQLQQLPLQLLPAFSASLMPLPRLSSTWSVSHQYWQRGRCFDLALQPLDGAIRWLQPWIRRPRGGRSTSKLVLVGIKVIGRNAKRSEHKTFVTWYRREEDRKYQDLEAINSWPIWSEFVNKDLDFSVGYYKGTTHIWVRTQWSVWTPYHTKSTQLWCSGLDQQKHKKRSKSPASQGSSDWQRSAQTAKKKWKTASEDKENWVDDTVDKLREKHGTSWSTIQWAETIVGGRNSLQNMPWAWSTLQFEYSRLTCNLAS